MAHVTFIHGIGNKPAADELHRIWLQSLAAGLDGINLGAEGITSSMVYWADVLYSEPDANVAAYERIEANTPKEVDADAASGPWPDPSQTISVSRPSCRRTA